VSELEMQEELRHLSASEAPRRLDCRQRAGDQLRHRPRRRRDTEPVQTVLGLRAPSA